MKVNLTEAERQQLRQLQKQRRDDEGYGKGTVLLLLDRGPSAGRMAEALSLDEGTVYRYARAWAWSGIWPTSAPATGGGCPAPRWPGCAGNWSRHSTPTAALFRPGASNAVGCAIRFPA
jgi:hypothetical protein